MRVIRNLIAVGAFSVVTLCIPAVASAQYGGYGNAGYTNDRDNDMRSIVRDLKSRAGEFQKELDRELDHSRYDGSRREDNINQLAKDFHSAAKRLNDNAVYNDPNLNEVLSLGSQLDRTMARTGLSHGVQNVWAGIRYDLNALGGRGSNTNRANRAGSRSWPY